MKILIDSAPDGYAVVFVSDEGERKEYTGGIHSLYDALDKADTLASAVEAATGQHVEPLVSAAAIRENRNKDIAARKLWNNPAFRVVK